MQMKILLHHQQIPDPQDLLFQNFLNLQHFLLLQDVLGSHPQD
jgi:hypothetical protein